MSSIISCDVNVIYKYCFDTKGHEIAQNYISANISKQIIILNETIITYKYHLGEIVDDVFSNFISSVTQSKAEILKRIKKNGSSKVNQRVRETIMRNSIMTNLKSLPSYREDSGLILSVNDMLMKDISVYKLADESHMQIFEENKSTELDLFIQKKLSDFVNLFSKIPRIPRILVEDKAKWLGCLDKIESKKILFESKRDEDRLIAIDYCCVSEKLNKPVQFVTFDNGFAKALNHLRTCTDFISLKMPAVENLNKFKSK